MDAPMVHNGVCIGTLNVANQKRKHHDTPTTNNSFTEVLAILFFKH